MVEMYTANDHDWFWFKDGLKAVNYGSWITKLSDFHDLRMIEWWLVMADYD